jgi:hypothetical protein
LSGEHLLPIPGPRSGESGARILTRWGFLRVAGAGAAGAVLLGGSSCGSGTEKSNAAETSVEETSVEETSVKKTDARMPITKRMNVILVILDSLRKDHVGAYGNDLTSTPTLDALAMGGCVRCIRRR